MLIGLVIMSALITLWVASTQFLKSTFEANQMPAFFLFNETRTREKDEYIIAKGSGEGQHSTVKSPSSVGSHVSLTHTNFDGNVHLSSKER